MKLTPPKPKSIKVIKQSNADLYAEKIPMKFFEVGTKVRIIGNISYHGFKLNTVVEVVYIERRSDGHINYLCKGIDEFGKDTTWWTRNTDMEYVGRA